jgi:uncharacterized protein YciW
MVTALQHDYRHAPVNAADLAMLEFVAQVAQDATRIKSGDLDQLRRVGFDDRAILQITLIAAWFSYINRVADALGVGRDVHPSRKNARDSNPLAEATSPAARRPADSQG